MSLLPKVTEYALACVLFRLYHAIFIGRITLIFLHDNRFDASDLIRGILKLLNKRTCARFIYFVPTGSLLRTTWKGNNSTFQHICQQLSIRHDRADRQLSPSLPVRRLVSQRKLRLTSNFKPMTRQQQDFFSHIYTYIHILSRGASSRTSPLDIHLFLPGIQSTHARVLWKLETPQFPSQCLRQHTTLLLMNLKRN